MTFKVSDIQYGSTQVTAKFFVIIKNGRTFQGRFQKFERKLSRCFMAEIRL